jgi:hypothetical protein
VAEGLVVQGFGERFLAGRELLGVGILGFEIGADARIGSIAEPPIVIDEDRAIDWLFGMDLVGNGGRGNRGDLRERHRRG